jgi:hypothetical protein
MISHFKWLLALAALASLALAGCGGAREVELKVLKNDGAATQPGPAASKEEVAGEVPPLRGLADIRPLVSPEMIPPEPPADPDPGFEPAP